MLMKGEHQVCTRITLNTVLNSLARFNPTLVSREECAAALLDHTHPISLSQVSYDPHP